MSLFDPRTDSPTGITTLEQSLLHHMLIANHLHANQYYNELGQGLQERFAAVSIIESANKDIRFIGRFSIILSPDYTTSLNQKFWMNALPWNDSAIPADFKSAT